MNGFLERNTPTPPLNIFHPRLNYVTDTLEARAGREAVWVAVCAADIDADTMVEDSAGWPLRLKSGTGTALPDSAAGIIVGETETSHWAVAGDQEALRDLNLHRPQPNRASPEQRAEARRRPEGR